MKKRKYYKNIWADFNKEKEMIFISGARQTGKTTLAKDIASKEPVSQYFNLNGFTLYIHTRISDDSPRLFLPLKSINL